MPAETHWTIRCDAPTCQVQLEDAQGHLLFPSREAAEELALELDWLITESPARLGRRAFCPAHWHLHFGARVPYWGVRYRRIRP